jgi:hypothetical protein
MSGLGHTPRQTGGMENPYIRAFNQAPSCRASDGGVKGILAIRP